MSEKMPMEIWAYEDYSGFVNGHWYKKWYSNTSKYHHDNKYRAAVKTAEQHFKLCSDLKVEVERLREENERLKTAIAEAKIVQYAVEG